MAQLPPKAPTIMTSHSHHYQNIWPSFSNYHQMLPPPPSPAAPPPFWVDEFLDFSSRRNSHRRSVSDPIAFAEVQFGDEHNTNTTSTNNNNNVVGTFERLDDEQLCSMFSDDVPPAVPSSSNPSTNDPSTTSTDQKSESEEKVMTMQQLKKEPGEVESDECQPEMQSDRPVDKDSGETIISDPKRVKRILANRQSAQRSRVRKLQYISELERSVTSLQTEVSALSPRVAFLDHQRLILNVDNSALKQRIAALAQDKLFKDAHQEALKKEIDRLRKVYHEQRINNNNMDNNNKSAVNAPQPPDSTATSDQQQQQQH